MLVLARITEFLSQIAWQADLAVSLYNISPVSDPPRARAALREALAIVDTLAHDGKLTAAQRGWQQRFADALAKLPVAAETAGVR